MDFEYLPRNLENLDLPKNNNLGYVEFTLISDCKTKSYVNSESYDEVYGKNRLIIESDRIITF